ncbi:TlpA family protein disulfide reductase [Spirosoma flavum]|uniref:TlpA family protein disulfide reductase n=1 Tax=Spirosoma flavum TaxID=2048557 RepID=A0ABW6AEE0_9BACT
MTTLRYFTYPLFFFFGFSLTSCQGADTLKITLHRSFLTASKINLTSVDMISMESMSIGHVLHRATNQTILGVIIPQSQFASLEIDGVFIPLFLEPGYDLQLYLDTLSRQPSVRFEGHSASANTYLTKANAIRMRVEQSAGKFYFELSAAEFVTHLKATKGLYAQLDQTFLAKLTLADSLKEVLSGRNQANLAFMQQNYAMTHPQPNQPADPLNVAGPPLPFSPHFIQTKMAEYAMVMNVYVSYTLPNLLGLQQMSSEQKSLLVDQYIQTGTFTPAEKEYLRAKNVHAWLTLVGISPETDVLFARYKTSFPHSVYFPTLAQLYHKWSTLAPGQPAPDFYGVTPMGDTLALSSLKGKVVYVDVWATWCGPCRAEFPQAKQLQQQFSADSAVVFLYVSIDQNQAAWKKLLQEDPQFEGVHINQVSTEQAGSLWKPYLLSGIPRYLLIDQQGRIVQANADRPSSGKVAEAIQKLLF